MSMDDDVKVILRDKVFWDVLYKLIPVATCQSQLAAQDISEVVENVLEVVRTEYDLAESDGE